MRTSRTSAIVEVSRWRAARRVVLTPAADDRWKVTVEKLETSYDGHRTDRWWTIDATVDASAKLSDALELGNAALEVLREQGWDVPAQRFGATAFTVDVT